MHSCMFKLYLPYSSLAIKKLIIFFYMITLQIKLNVLVNLTLIFSHIPT